ncbi:MAG: LptF/LptG family permease [Phycisphaerales bacterium]
MTILDRYILKQFLINFVILIAALFLFYCMVDLFLNLDRFFEVAERLTEGEGAAQRIWRVVTLVFDYYGPQFFLLYTYLMGFGMIGAMGFTLVQLHRNREMTAVLAAGVSLHRIVMPLIVAALVLNALQFANRELVLPQVAAKLLRSHGEIGAEEVGGFRVKLVPDSFDRIYFASNYFQDERRMDDLVVWEYSPDLYLERIISADSATWTEGGWALTNGLATRPAPEDARGLEATGRPIDFIETDLDPTTLLLRRYGEYRQMLNLNQIGELIEKPGIYDINELRRIKFRRFAGFLNNMLTLLITLPFFMLREPRPLLPQAVKCSVLGIGAQIGGALGATLGLPGLPAAAGVFAFPLLVLLPLAALMLSSVET